MADYYHKVNQKLSKKVTRNYSTSFSLGISLLGKEIQQDIYNIYGFVRLADEIVDSMGGHDQSKMLNELETEVYKAIEQGISTNPLVDAFQITVNKYGIYPDLINQFLNSMKMDLEKVDYDEEKYKLYILGSAEVVGLMCLQVFVDGDTEEYERLKPYAMSLGSFFQKVNFLRDLGEDYNDLDRIYFPEVDVKELNDNDLKKIYEDIDRDFIIAKKGIWMLPKNSSFGVYLALQYYHKLYYKIQQSGAKKLLNKRIRIPNYQKFWILLCSFFIHKTTRLENG